MLKQMVRDGLVKLAATRDYHVIPGWQLNSYPQARYLQRLFQFCGISVVIDVGANRGQYRDFLRRDVGYDGEIIPLCQDSCRFF